MNFDLQTLVRVSDFREEDKKRILEIFDTLTPQEMLKLWDVCLDNLSWKFNIEFTKRLQTMTTQGTQMEKDTQDYKRLENQVLTDIFSQAEVEASTEKIEDVRNLIKNFQQGQVSPVPETKVN